LPPYKAYKRTAFSKKKIARLNDQLLKLTFLFLSLYPYRPSGLGCVVGRLRGSGACDLARWEMSVRAGGNRWRTPFPTRQSTRKAERGRPTTQPSPGGTSDQLRRNAPTTQPSPGGTSDQPRRNATDHTAKPRRHSLNFAATPRPTSPPKIFLIKPQ